VGTRLAFRISWRSASHTPSGSVLDSSRPACNARRVFPTPPAPVSVSKRASESVDLMAAKTKEYLDALKKIQADGKEIEIYKENLDDAIEGTQDAMNDAEKAKKTVAPPPVRRKTGAAKKLRREIRQAT